ncbi:MAG: amidohydrolase [Gammaproteobacteria bacterium]|nr:amidohydrolase [Gammaproteobacteria bacterium]
MALPGSNEWRALITEEILEPERPIIDPHHHLWPTVTRWGSYSLEDLWSDTMSGHNIEKTVFIDCGASYRIEGPVHLKPVGETEYVRVNAERSAATPGKTRIAGIVGHADMMLPEAELREVLAEHERVGGGLFRGIRHAGPHDDTGTLLNPGTRGPGLYSKPGFRDGVRLLGKLGYTYDAWHFFHQNRDYLDLARAAPDTVMILDHFGTPLGVGPYASRQDEIFATWKADMAEIARCPNVVAKLGGMAMPDNGYGWHTRGTPPSSNEFVKAQRDWYLHTIDCFGPDRCMFESNFPVDKLSIAYPVLWNALKKIAAGFSESEKHAMFYGTAARIYRV